MSSRRKQSLPFRNKHINYTYIYISPRCRLDQSGDSRSVIVCGVLCYIQNKVRYVPCDTLKKVVLRAFSEEEIHPAKDLIFEDSSVLLALKDVRKKAR